MHVHLSRARRDHGLQVVRRAGPGEGPPAGEGVAPALDLRDGLRGDDRPAAGRGRAELPRDRPRGDRARGPQADRQGPRVDPDGGDRDPGAGLHARSRTSSPAPGAPSGRSARPARPADRWRRCPDAARAALDAVLAGSSRGAVVEADNLDVLAAIPDGAVDLAYADPPFATGRPRRLVSIRTGSGERTRPGFRGPEVAYETVSDLAWDDDLPLDLHLDGARGARPRDPPGACRRTGRSTCTWTGGRCTTCGCCSTRCSGRSGSSTSSSGPTTTAAGPRDRWPRKHDTILWYAKGDRWLFDREAIDRIPYMAPGLVGPEKAARGKLPTDVWWMTIVPPASAERTGLPDPEAGPAPGADRGGVEPAGRPRAGPVRGLRDDGRRGGAARAALAAGGPEPGRRGDRPAAAGGRGRGGPEP